jgi:hypothetical protein
VKWKRKISDFSLPLHNNHIKMDVSIIKHN